MALIYNGMAGADNFSTIAIVILAVAMYFIARNILDELIHKDQGGFDTEEKVRE